MRLEVFIMIRLATLSDLDSIMKVIKESQIRMKNMGMTQWQNNYPNVEVIKGDLDNKAIYVYIVNNEIISTMSVFSHDPVYHAIDGAWLNNNPYMVIHRIAVSNNYIKKGIAKKMIDFVFNHFNVDDIRIDTHPKNIPMITSLEKQGFIYCGIIHVTTDKDSLRYAYHKHIK